MNEPTSQPPPAGESAVALNNEGGVRSDHNASAMRLPRWTWQGLLAVTSALVGLSAVILHLVGSAIHQTYLLQWGLDAGQFPKSPDWLVIQGYYGIWSALGIAFSALLKNVLWVILIGIFVALYLALVFGPWTPFGTNTGTSSWMSKLPNWARISLQFSAGGALVAIALLPTTLSLFLFIGIPAQVGKGIGEKLVEKQAEDFVKGCADSKRSCIRLLKDGNLAGEGYLIESSPSHIAFLDTSLKKARVIARERLEVQIVRLPYGL